MTKSKPIETMTEAQIKAGQTPEEAKSYPVEGAQIHNVPEVIEVEEPIETVEEPIETAKEAEDTSVSEEKQWQDQKQFILGFKRDSHSR